jgi:hypothetical protein
MTNTCAFKISHSWGDPREPETQNGLPVSFAFYSENDLHLSFRIFGIQKKDLSSINWYLEAPPNTRATLGRRWQEREMIFQRVMDYLANLEPMDRWRAAGSNFTGICVDTSKIVGLVPTVLGLVRKRLTSVQLLYLPNSRTALTLSLGFLCIFVNSRNYFPQISPGIFKSVSFLLGVASVAQFIRGVQRDYEHAKLLALMQTLGNPKFNWRRLTVKLLFTGCKWRYAVTLTLALVLVFLALSIGA